MNAAAFSEEFVRAVGDGIREYNRQLPPVPVRIVAGVVQEPTPAEAAYANEQWYDAVRFGLTRAAARGAS